MADFFRATSDTLPSVDFMAILEFLDKNPNYSSAEFRGFKATRSSKADYGDKAVGYVELRRDGVFCFVRGKITPEHKVRQKPYQVWAKINEEDGQVVAADCKDCAASEGGCKHVLAFLFWLHRRSEEPSPTEVTSYWKKSALSSVGQTSVYTIKEFCGASYRSVPQKTTVALEEAKKIFSPGSSLLLTDNWLQRPFEDILLHQLIGKFRREGHANNGEAFIKYASSLLTRDMSSSLEEETREQFASTLWHEARYGRVTASTLHQCCHYYSGESLPDKILGAGRALDTTAMARGRKLEPIVLSHLQTLLGVPLRKCGFFTNPSFPFLGASPDAVSEDFIVEVKCPTKDIKNYIKENAIVQKYEAQVQLEMYLAGKEKGLFVVADPKFEENKKVVLKWVSLDEEFLVLSIFKAKEFWLTTIFPNLYISSG